MANTIDKLNKARSGNLPGALCFVDSKRFSVEKPW